MELIPKGTPVTDERYFYRVRVPTYERRNSYKWVYQPLSKYDIPQVDHKLCKANGGTDELDNLVLSCGLCNHSKWTSDYAEFVAQIEAGKQS